MAIDLNGINITKLKPNAERSDQLAAEARESNRSQQAKDARQTRAEREADQVKLSQNANALDRLEDEIRAADTFDEQRVAAISQAISEGRYPVNSERIAQKFLELESQLY